MMLILLFNFRWLIEIFLDSALLQESVVVSNVVSPVVLMGSFQAFSVVAAFALNLFVTRV